MEKKSKHDEKYLRFMKRVGRRVREVREEQGLTLEQVEEKGYHDWKHLQKIESGNPVTLATLYKLAKTLKVHPSEFISNIPL